jgi:ribosomal protein S18 acetylase RimI-like enzyme
MDIGISTTEDARKGLSLLRHFWSDWVPAPDMASYDEGMFVEHYDAYLLRSDGFAVVLKVENDIAGIVIVTHPAEFYQLNLVLIDHAHQGRGYGRTLLDGTLSILREHGDAGEVRLRTWSTNVAARKLYERVGFRILETVPDHRGPGVDTVIYGMSL